MKVKRLDNCHANGVDHTLRKILTFELLSELRALMKTGPRCAASRDAQSQLARLGLRGLGVCGGAEFLIRMGTQQFVRNCDELHLFFPVTDFLTAAHSLDASDDIAKAFLGVIAGLHVSDAADHCRTRLRRYTPEWTADGLSFEFSRRYLTEDLERILTRADRYCLTAHEQDLLLGLQGCPVFSRLTVRAVGFEEAAGLVDGVGIPIECDGSFVRDFAFRTDVASAGHLIAKIVLSPQAATATDLLDLHAYLRLSGTLRATADDRRLLEENLKMSVQKFLRRQSKCINSRRPDSAARSFNPCAASYDYHEEVIAQLHSENLLITPLSKAKIRRMIDDLDKVVQAAVT